MMNDDDNIILPPKSDHHYYLRKKHHDGALLQKKTLICSIAISLLVYSTNTATGTSFTSIMHLTLLLSRLSYFTV